MAEEAADTAKWEGVREWWGRLNPPFTPSEGELGIYEKHFREIAKRPNPKLLILGATPSLRELGHELGYEVTIVDINPEMVESATKLMGRKNPEEKAVIGDWLIVELPENHYDLIVGDHSIINIDYKDQPKLLRKIHKSLKPDGLTLLATTIFERENLNFTWDDLVREANENPSRFEDVLDRWLFAFSMMQDPEIRDPGTRLYHLDAYDAKLDRLAEEGKIPKETAEKLKYNMGKWAAVFLEKPEFEKIVKEKFEILPAEHDPSHPYFKFQWIYALRKK